MDANSEQDIAPTLIAMWHAAFDRFSNGDPSGFLEIYAPDVTFFDPSLARRIDGLEELTRHLESRRGKIQQTYELINPKVQTIGNAAVLTLNYITHRGSTTGKSSCTEVFRNDGDRWLIIQTHVSSYQDPS